MSEKAADSNSVIGNVITRSHAIDRLLRRHYNAPGRGLHKAIDDLAGTLPAVLARTIRVIAIARNAAAHPDRPTHQTTPDDFDRLCDEIEILIPFFAARQTSKADAVPTNAATSASHNTATKPANWGKPWTPAEVKRLVEAFDAHTPIPQLAKAHERGVGGIQSRLVKLGKLKTDQLKTFPVSQ